jgi:hypothetical protein
MLGQHRQLRPEAELVSGEGHFEPPPPLWLAAAVNVAGPGSSRYFVVNPCCPTASAISSWLTVQELLIERHRSIQQQIGAGRERGRCRP